MKEAIGGAVDVFSGLMQGLMDRSIQYRIQTSYKKLKPQIRQQMPRQGGVLLVVGVALPRAGELPSVPTQKEFLGMFIAGAGQNAEAVWSRYLNTRPIPLVNRPRNVNMYRKEYYYWIRPADLARW